MNTSQPRTKTGRRLSILFSVATISVGLGVAAGITGRAMSSDATTTAAATRARVETSAGALPFDSFAQPGAGLHVWTQTTEPTLRPCTCNCRMAPDRLPLADVS